MNNTYLDPGCYVDGHWGNYAISRMLTIADDILGTTFYQSAADSYYNSPTIVQNPDTGVYEDGPLPDDEWDGFTYEDMYAIADEAEAALNAHAPDHLVWHWHDGEFFLSPTCDDDPDCSDETCLCHCY